MSEVWDTRDGRRRVRRDPPTIDDAALAAQGLSEDLEAQVEIVTSLMPVSAEEAKRAVLKMRRSRDDNLLTIAGRAGGSRSVVVERKSPRRAVVQSRANGSRRGLG
jgi:pyrrolidone-carboxylate peptidase